MMAALLGTLADVGLGMRGAEDALSRRSEAERIARINAMQEEAWAAGLEDARRRRADEQKMRETLASFAPGGANAIPGSPARQVPATGLDAISENPNVVLRPAVPARANIGGALESVQNLSLGRGDLPGYMAARKAAVDWRQEGIKELVGNIAGGMEPQTAARIYNTRGVHRIDEDTASYDPKTGIFSAGAGSEIGRINIPAAARQFGLVPAPTTLKVGADEAVVQVDSTSGRAMPLFQNTAGMERRAAEEAGRNERFAQEESGRDRRLGKEYVYRAELERIRAGARAAAGGDKKTPDVLDDKTFHDRVKAVEDVLKVDPDFKESIEGAAKMPADAQQRVGLTAQLLYLGSAGAAKSMVPRDAVRIAKAAEEGKAALAPILETAPDGSLLASPAIEYEGKRYKLYGRATRPADQTTAATDFQTALAPRLSSLDDETLRSSALLRKRAEQAGLTLDQAIDVIRGRARAAVPRQTRAAEPQARPVSAEPQRSPAAAPPYRALSPNSGIEGLRSAFAQIEAIRSSGAPPDAQNKALVQIGITPEAEAQLRAAKEAGAF